MPSAAVMAAPPLILLFLIAGISQGERSEDGLQTRRAEGEAPVARTGFEPDAGFQLKWMYNSPIKREALAKAAGVSNVAVDPLFLDLDNIDQFNDISFSEDPTPFPIAEEEKTTKGPVVVGVDEKGRSILRFVSNWQNEVEVTQSTTRTTTAESTTAETITTPFTSTTTVPVTSTTTEAPTTANTVTTQETTQTNPIPTTTAAIEIIPTISSFFDLNNGLEDTSVQETTTTPSVQENSNPEDNIWWTPKPSFLGMSSVLVMENHDERKEEQTRDWQPLWKASTETTTPVVTTTTVEPTTSTLTAPEIQKELGPNRFLSRLRKVAEQSVLNDLELIAGSMNMKELVSQLKGEQKLPQVIDPEQTDMALAMKRKTLAQLEILNRLADRKEELEQLINVQRRILLRARGSRTNIIVGQTEGEAEIQNDVDDQSLIIPVETSTAPLTTPPFAFHTRAAQKRRHLKKRKEYTPRPRRQRQKEIRHFVAMPPRGPMVEEVRHPTTVGELTHLLEREMRQAQRDVLTEEMRQFCSQALCSFEKGDTCRFETSYDEVTRRRHLRRRITREAPLYVIRSWSNWVGQPSVSSHRVDRAPHFSARNTRFAAVFLEPQQLASLTLSVPIRSSFTIRFRGWEASSGVRLRVCCDDFCPFSTEVGRSNRRWRRLSATCPADTRQLAFECENMNMGGRKGVCGVDDVFIAADGCPKLFDGPVDP